MLVSPYSDASRTTLELAAKNRRQILHGVNIGLVGVLVTCCKNGLYQSAFNSSRASGDDPTLIEEVS